jgi:hypothetical protein
VVLKDCLVDLTVKGAYGGEGNVEAVVSNTCGGSKVGTLRNANPCLAHSPAPTDLWQWGPVCDGVDQLPAQHQLCLHTQLSAIWLSPHTGACLPWISISLDQHQLPGAALRSPGQHTRSRPAVTSPCALFDSPCPSGPPMIVHVIAGRLQGRAGGHHICWAHRSCCHQGCTCNQHGDVSPGCLCTECHSKPERCADRLYPTGTKNSGPAGVAFHKEHLC